VVADLDMELSGNVWYVVAELRVWVREA